MKSLLWSVLGLLLSTHAQAANFFSPFLCKVADSYLIAKNMSQQDQHLWFQALGTNPLQEAHLVVPANAAQLIYLQDYFTAESSAFFLKTIDETSLQLTGFCKSTSQSWSLSHSPSPWKTLRLSLETQQIQLRLLNLAQQKNKVEIRFKSWLGLPLSSQSQVLDADFATTILTLAVPFEAQSLEIRAEGRLGAMAFDNNAKELSLQDETAQVATAAQTRYFLFTSQGANTKDSFVVPMTDETLIQQTLDQIADPAKGRLLMARIEKTLGGSNRDFSETSKSPWSWNVIEAQKYADFAHISCDGSPAIVEERIDEWLANTGGTICFWNYRVKRELAAEEVRQSPWSSLLGPPSLPPAH